MSRRLSMIPAVLAACLAPGLLAGQSFDTSPPGMIVVLDPGHGGSDTGARGQDGLLEKEATLEVAVRLKERIESELGVKVILTRSGDYEVSHLERASMADHNRASLFLSLHLGASASQSADVFAAFYAEPRPHREADRQSASAFWKDWNSQNDRYREASRALAGELQAALSTWLTRGAAEPLGGDWLVLKGVACPAAMLELGALTNPERLRSYRDPAFLDELTGVLFRSLVVRLGGGRG